MATTTRINSTWLRARNRADRRAATLRRWPTTVFYDGSSRVVVLLEEARALERKLHAAAVS